MAQVRRGVDLRYAVLAAGLIMCLLLTMLPGRNASAATGFIDPNGDGTTASDWAVTPSGTRSSAIDDAVREPSSPNTSDFISFPTNKTGNAFFLMGTLGSVSSVSSIQLWIYHNDGSNGQVHAALYNSAETGVLGAEQSFTVRSSSAWDVLTFSGLSLTQSDLDGLRVRFRADKPGGGGPSTVNIYAMYGVVTYTPSVLSVDMVDNGGNPVASPSVTMSPLDVSFACQTSTATLGTASAKIRVGNTTANGNWTLSIAATGGASASWSNGVNSYDFNDPAGGGCDGGQLTVDASSAIRSSSCSTSELSPGASAAFSDSVSAITMLTAAGSQTGCDYDLTDIDLTQMVPAEVPANGVQPYTIDLTLTVIAN